MTRFRVELSIRAQRQLAEIESYIAAAASAVVARRFVRSLLDRCETLQNFPLRGTPRDELRPGLRSVPHRRNATILYAVEDDTVTIVGIYHAGQDLKAALRDPLN